MSEHDLDAEIARDNANDRMEELQTRCSALEAENARLRAALPNAEQLREVANRMDGTGYFTLLVTPAVIRSWASAIEEATNT